MEVASKDAKATKAVNPHKGRRICIAVIGVIVVIVVIVVILALTVFKAKRPVTTVNSMAVDDLDVSLDIPKAKVHLNVSLRVNLTVKNPNKVGFKYSNSSALLNYRGQLVGEAPIPAGKISADQTMPFNLSLTVMADRLLSDSNLYSDVLSGTLPLNTYTRLSGKVYILKIFKVHVVSETSCDVTVNVLNRTIANQQCKYKTKL